MNSWAYNLLILAGTLAFALKIAFALRGHRRMKAVERLDDLGLIDFVRSTKSPLLFLVGAAQLRERGMERRFVLPLALKMMLSQDRTERVFGWAVVRSNFEDEFSGFVYAAVRPSADMRAAVTQRLDLELGRQSRGGGSRITT